MANGLYEGFIQNELIDGASDQINSELDMMMEAHWTNEERRDGHECTKHE